MKDRNHIVYFLTEITIVVIGVLIAVSIGNYKERLENEKYVKKTLSAIENEIRLSQSDVDTVLKKHLKLYEKLKVDFGEDGQSLGEFIVASGGLQMAEVKNVSLRFFVSNKAELLDFKLISQLLDIEFRADLLAKKLDRLGNFAYDNINDSGKDVKMKFTYLLSDVIDGEYSLLKSYSDLLDENKAYLTGKAE